MKHISNPSDDLAPYAFSGDLFAWRNTFCRVFCIGKNYADHVLEMGGVPDTDDVVVFMKPVTSLVPEGIPVEIPRNAGRVHHEMELVVLVGKAGKNILEKNAIHYISGITLGVDLTLRDVQARLKKEGKPWERSKSFDFSAPVGHFISPEALVRRMPLKMTCRVNGETRQSCSTDEMRYSPQQLVSIISRYWKLETGDLIFTGTPSGVGEVKPGDSIIIESADIGRFQWMFI